MTRGKPPRLERIFQRYDPPVYFVTFCMTNRRKILANERVHAALIEYGVRAWERNIALGRYVIMSDHIHLFVSGDAEFNLGVWIRGLKRVVAAAVTGGRGIAGCGNAQGPAASDGGSYKQNVWQRGFFDHVLRNSESYAQKWDYVRENPVRANLVNEADQWPFQGEIVVIDRV